MIVFLCILYAYPLLVSLSNLILMRSPKPVAGAAQFSVLIPARNEESNLRELFPILVQAGLRVYVFDDESSDGTAEVARSHGAVVIRAREPLPEGWTGKNRACHELALAAAEDSPHAWMLFMDADVRPKEGFAEAVNGLIANEGLRAPVVTGFLDMDNRLGFERLYLSWVPWVLLATNPFGLVSRSGRGHNRFTNGQFVLWKGSSYMEILPHQSVKSAILEDVLIGRLLARLGARVEVVKLRSVAKVQMYENLAQAVAGMSKNAFQITGNTAATIALSAVLALWAIAWLFAPTVEFRILAYLSLVASESASAVITGLSAAFLLPVPLLGAAYTLVRSALLAKKGRLEWKGRTYPG